MYVSPFIDMAQTYHFTILPPDEKLSIKINEKDKDGLLLLPVKQEDFRTLMTGHC